MDEFKRLDKINYYLDIAEAVSERGTCYRKNYGSIIVKNDEVISTGYTGAPRGRINCIDLGYCVRREKFPEIGNGERFDICRSVHSEQNAIISAARKDMIGASLFMVGKYSKIRKYNNDIAGTYAKDPDSCQFCKRFIINSGIEKVYIRINKDEYKEINVADWIDKDELLEGNLGYK
ncbi:MAG: cytidine deaminase [Clostridia bacterium]|nr:cytidine deaminase [Clostridia bacterium]